MAKGARAGIWRDLAEEELKQNKSKVNDFTGRVVEIHTGDSLTIEKENDFSLQRVFLSSLKGPLIQRKGNEQIFEPYAWESKENLRKLAIGKQVRVEMEYSKAIPSKQGSADFVMNFGTVFLAKNNKNLGVCQLEKGLVRTNIH